MCWARVTFSSNAQDSKVGNRENVLKSPTIELSPFYFMHSCIEMDLSLRMVFVLLLIAMQSLFYKTFLHVRSLLILNMIFNWR